MNNPDIWVLLDLRGLVLHAYHSGTDQESPERAVRSPNHTLDKFTNRYLLPITKLVPLNRIIAVNDAGNNFRKAIDPDYKATRKEPEPAVKAAMEASRHAIRELLHSLGVMQVSVAGTEADDVVAYLAKNLPGGKFIYTVDADLIALSGAHVQVFLKGEPHNVFRKDDIVVQPRHVTLFKSIVGDSSDNIKGVKGLGPAAWADLVDEVGEDGLDELVEIIESEDFSPLKVAAAESTGKVLGKLVESVSDWRRSYMLAKLRPELVDSRQGKEFTRLRWEKRLPSRDRLSRLAMTAGAYWLIEDLQHLLPNQYLITAKDWDDTTLAEAKELFSKSRFISIDWESWNPYQEHFKAADDKYVDMYGQIISGMGLTCGENLEHTFYFQFDHADEENNLDKEHLVELLDCIPDGMPIVAQNAYFERTVFMREFGYDIPNLHDTKIMASHVDESLPSGLKDMSKHWLNYNQIRYDQVVEKGKTMKDYPGHHVFQYGADDPLVTAHLYDLFYIILCLEGTWPFVERYEFPMTYVLSDAYLAGVSIDFDEVERQRAEDQATYDNNLLRIRELMVANLDEESIYRGASNWLEELMKNNLGECRFILAQAAEIAQRKGKFSESSDLMKIASSVITDETTLDEVTICVKNHFATLAGLSYEEYGSTLDSMVGSIARSRAPLWKKAVEAATYEPYVESHEPSKFMWTLGKVNQLSEAYNLPAWPSITDFDAAHSFVAGLGVMKAEAANFAHTVLECIAMPDNKRNKSAAKKALADDYMRLIPGKPKKSGTELNLDSPKQMNELFYAMLGLPIRLRSLEVSESRSARGLEGAPQANEDAILSAIAYGDATGWKKEVLELLLKAKKAATRIKFFYSKFPLWKHPMDGMVHPQFNSVGTETRRPTGSAPNMLQLSKKGDGVKVRRCILPNKKLGHDLIVLIDFDAQELRVTAMESGDPVLTACYVGDNKLDVHSVTAAGMAKMGYTDFVRARKGDDEKLAKLMDDIRKKAKNVNFGSIYGIGAEKLARQLLGPVEEAQEFLIAKKATYPRQEEWKVEVKNELHAKGYVTTMFGSRKHLFNKLNDSDRNLVAYYERASVNFKIQGACADILKRTLADMWRAQTLTRHGAVLVAPIYDEVAMSCHSSQAVGLVAEVLAFMCRQLPTDSPVPMLANPSLGLNFADQIEILKDADDPLTDDKILVAMDKAFGIEQKEAA